MIFSDKERMKRYFKIFLMAAAFCNLCLAFAKDNKKPQNIEFTTPYEYRVIVNEIEGVTAPYQKDDYIVFTAKDGPRHIGIVFDFEDYKEIHSFMRKTTTDIEGNIIDSVYFYILDLPKNIDSISYRLIIDGIWTTDPQNFNSYYNPYTGISVSTLSVKNNHVDETQKTDKGVHFIYMGESGQKVRLGGTFTNWDSSIYELHETRPGYYELYLPLPEGTYYYAYYTGTKSFAEVTNPDRAWSGEGREASKIVVN